jgi:hypothetical protein
MKIRLLITREGLGEKGEVLEVSENRAGRWCRDGLAELVSGKKKKMTPQIAEAESAKAEPQALGMKDLRGKD